MAIEDVAHSNPEAIHKLKVNPLKGLDIADLKQAAINLGLKDYEDQVIGLFQKLYQCFTDKDCDMIEINPLVLTKQGVIMAADSKVTLRLPVEKSTTLGVWTPSGELLLELDQNAFPGKQFFRFDAVPGE